MRCGLLGQTLAHSHSPLLHSLLGDYAYTLFEKAPDQVEDFLKNGSWDGLNVTIPYKKTAYALCDSLSPIARDTGHVNTLLRRRDGSIFGDNTDAFGFRYLLERLGSPWPGSGPWCWAPAEPAAPHAPFCGRWAPPSPCYPARKSPMIFMEKTMGYCIAHTAIYPSIRTHKS